MIPIVTPQEMGDIDAAAVESVDVLVGRAGWAVARTALDMLGGAYGRVVNLIAGPGNNGADGRVACAHLERRGVRVRTYEAADCPAVLPPSDLVLDAAFGTGFRGEWAAPDPAGAPVLAVDIPSGVDGMTGQAGAGVMAATCTVTFQAYKPGLLLGAGPALCGLVEVADIGLDATRAQASLVTADDVSAWIPRRAADAHKWRQAVRVVAGSEGMTGAAALATAATARMGAGLVHLVTAGDGRGVRDEIVWVRVDETDLAAAACANRRRFGSVVAGPGLGRHAATVDTIRALAAADVPLLVDGDGLMAFELGTDGEPIDHAALQALAMRAAPCVLTPHDGEFTRVAGAPPGHDRLAAARSLAGRLAATVLLKGATTVVAEPDGDVLVVDAGDERLATAGSGDVLSGLIGALLAAGCPAARAAAAGAWIHAAAANRLLSTGLLAGDLVEAVPLVLADLR